MPIGPFGEEFLRARSISAETAERYRIYTGSVQKGGHVVADRDGKILCFPYIEDGVIVAVKYRDMVTKRFWQKAGGKSTFWNHDCLHDPGLEAGYKPLVITEGELDALAAIECGLSTVVSVPEGAPAPRKEQDEEPIDPKDEETGKFRFCWRNRDKLKRVKRYVLAVDNDEPGKLLAHEMVRRLGAWRCHHVAYPAGKDLNDVLTMLGPESVISVIDGAKPYPVRGVYRLSEFPQPPEHRPLSTGWKTLDRHLALIPGEFMVVTGIPGHGKTAWVLNLIANMAELHGWRAAIFSPEMPVLPYLRDRMRCLKTGRPDSSADSWIEQNFLFIAADPDDDAGDYDLDWVLDKATIAVKRDGVDVLLIDPWNEIEHARHRDESMPDYIGRAIRALKAYARKYQVAVIVVAHPTKAVCNAEGVARRPSLYDIEGSAHWANKPDHGVIVWRDSETDETTVTIAKVRFDDTGERGTVKFSFNRETGRFLTLDAARQEPAGAEF